VGRDSIELMGRAASAPALGAPEPPAPIRPVVAARLVERLGFLASSDFPDRPGPAWLAVAIRPQPTLRHYDPETVEYWRTVGGHGARDALTRWTRVPLHRDYSWGLIRIADRLGATNEFLSFGGTLLADRVGEDLVAAFTSPAPLLRRGGHSQPLDPAAACLGAWYGRLLLAVAVVPGFEAMAAGADPVARYAAFLLSESERYRCLPLRDVQAELGASLWTEAQRVAAEHPAAWEAGRRLVDAMAQARSSSRVTSR